MKALFFFFSRRTCLTISPSRLKFLVCCYITRETQIRSYEKKAIESPCQNIYSSMLSKKHRVCPYYTHEVKRMRLIGNLLVKQAYTNARDIYGKKTKKKIYNKFIFFFFFLVFLLLLRSTASDTCQRNLLSI